MQGFLSCHDHPFRKTHNLIELGEECVTYETRLEPVLRRAAVLTEYAWKFRYPGEPEEPTVEEAEEAIALADEVYEATIALIPKEVMTGQSVRPRCLIATFTTIKCHSGGSRNPVIVCYY